MSGAALALNQIDALVRTQNDPVWFAEEVLNLKGGKYYLDEWQKELLEAVSDVHRKQRGLPTVINHEGKSMITVRAMHGPGKTFTVAAIMHWFNCAFRGRIICTAPKEKQLATRLWPAFRKIAVRADIDYAASIKVDSTKIVWHNDQDWCAIAETASQPENLAGYHDDYMLFIVDEASGVDEAMYPVIEGAVSTGTLCILLLIGNPTKNIGTFHASHCIPKVAQHYHQVHVDLNKTTRVDKAWVKRMVDKYGENSPVVKVRCYGEFADGDSRQIFAYQWLMDALGREGIGEGLIPKLRITVDVADGGDNFTVITIGRMYNDGEYLHVIKQLQYSFPAAESPILAGQTAIQLFKDYGGSIKHGDDLVVDALGVGAGTAGYLIERGMPVIPYRGGEPSDDTTQWRNRRVQSYIGLRDAHRDKKISYAEDFTDDWDDFTAQMCSIRSPENASEKVDDLEPKHKLLVSPDKADSLAMMYATQSPAIAQQLGTICEVADSMASEARWD